MKQLPLFDPIEIRLNKGYVTFIDPIDADLAQISWLCRPRGDEDRRTGYVRRNLRKNGKQCEIYLHRVILERKLGRSLTPGEQVDHIDGDGLNNRRSNLRVASWADNQHNKGKPRNNTSGYKGVCWFKPTHKWVAQIVVDSKRHNLGYFNTPQQAHEAYSAAARKYFGEFARVD